MPPITSAAQWQIAPYETALTNYKGVAGTNIGCRLGKCDGLLWLTSFQFPVRMKHITDGTSHTLMIGEDVPIQNNHSAAYYANGDYSTTEGPLNLSFEPPTPDVWWLVMTFRSTHPGGAHFCAADGSVHFVDETIDFTLYQQLSTRAGSEQIAIP